MRTAKPASVPGWVRVFICLMIVLCFGALVLIEAVNGGVGTNIVVGSCSLLLVLLFLVFGLHPPIERMTATKSRTGREE